MTARIHGGFKLNDIFAKHKSSGRNDVPRIRLGVQFPDEYNHRYVIRLFGSPSLKLYAEAGWWYPSESVDLRKH
jgi:hypothetical protein